jgi:hypothetical protein
MRTSRESRFACSLVLALAVYAALPSIEWCPIRWADCDFMCEAAAACDGTQSESCAAPASCSGENACALPCDASPDPVPLGDRAWCIHPPVDGLVARDLLLPLPSLGAGLAIVPESVLAPAPPPAARCRVAGAARSPVLAAAHAPPLARAPPHV